MQIDWWTLALQTINALVLIWLLTRFLFRPVAAVINARQEAVNSLLAEAEATRAAANNVKAQMQSELNDVAVRRKETLAATTNEAEALKQTLLNDARREVEEMRDQTRKTIVDMRHQLDAETDARAKELALDIAGRLFDRLPDTARVHGFIEGIVNTVAALPEAARDALGDPGQTLHLTSARELSTEESTAIEAGLARAVGHAVVIKPTVDPDLIAGLELEGRHCSVHNSFRSDLLVLTKALASTDTGTN